MSSYGRSSWTSFFFWGGEGMSCYDSSYLGEFFLFLFLFLFFFCFCFPEATKFRFHESRVIAKNR